MTVEDKSSPLDLRAVEARHPATVVLEAGEHHSQDVRERIHAHVDVTALLVHCRALRAALDDICNRAWEIEPIDTAAVGEAIERGAAVLGLARDEEAPGEADPQLSEETHG